MIEKIKNITDLNVAIDEALSALENLKAVVNENQINEFKRAEAGEKNRV